MQNYSQQSNTNQININLSLLIWGRNRIEKVFLSPRFTISCLQCMGKGSHLHDTQWPPSILTTSSIHFTNHSKKSKEVGLKIGGNDYRHKKKALKEKGGKEWQLLAEAHSGAQSFSSDFKASDKVPQGKTLKWTTWILKWMWSTQASFKDDFHLRRNLGWTKT